MAEKLPTYGGQALIEGVLMRGSHYLAAAMRAPDGQIVVQTEALQGIYRSPFAKWPFLRGLVILWDSLGLGFRYLTQSANLQAGEDEKIEGASQIGTIAFALIFAIGIFFVAPTAAGQLFERFLGINAWWANVIEGVIRLGLMVGYIWSIGKMPEIQRVFSYHGAEHKTINAFEAGAELTPENVSKFSLEHPRCGTSFLLTLFLLSIIVFSLLGPMPAILKYLSRIVFIPLLAGIAYEYIRLMAAHLGSPLVRFLIKPNLALQRLTTRQPSLEMLEVSIAAFNSMLNLELGSSIQAVKETYIQESAPR
jgi:uncharacterized protein YqhQ